jgi:hypothetical protein
MLLIAIGLTFDADEARFLLTPTTFGGLGAHLLAAQPFPPEQNVRMCNVAFTVSVSLQAE